MILYELGKGAEKYGTFAFLYGEKMVCSSVIPCGRRDGMEQELLKQALGPKVGSVTLSPRGDWRMPSDASVAMWLEDLK